MSETIEITKERIIQAGLSHPEAQPALSQLFPGVSFEPVVIEISAIDAAALRYLLRHNITVVEFIGTLTGYNSWGPVPSELGRAMGRVGNMIDEFFNKKARQ